MKRHIMLLTSAALLMLAGCFRNPTAKSVQTAESAALGEIAEVRTTCKASTTPDGEPVISDCQGTFYQYAGRRWWKDLDQPAGSFILKDDGKYYPYLDEENDPGAAINPEFKIYQTVESFNGGGWEYAGTIDGRDFYVDVAHEVMLCFVDITDEQDNSASLPDGEREFLIGMLKPSAISE